MQAVKGGEGQGHLVAILCCSASPGRSISCCSAGSITGAPGAERSGWSAGKGGLSLR